MYGVSNNGRLCEQFQVCFESKLAQSTPDRLYPVQELRHDGLAKNSFPLNDLTRRRWHLDDFLGSGVQGNQLFQCVYTCRRYFRHRPPHAPGRG